MDTIIYRGSAYLARFIDRYICFNCLSPWLTLLVPVENWFPRACNKCTTIYGAQWSSMEAHCADRQGLQQKYHCHVQPVRSHILTEGGSRTSTSVWLWQDFETVLFQACRFRVSARAVQTSSRTQRRGCGCCAPMFAVTQHTINYFYVVEYSSTLHLFCISHLFVRLPPVGSSYSCATLLVRPRSVEYVETNPNVCCTLLKQRSTYVLRCWHTAMSTPYRMLPTTSVAVLAEISLRSPRKLFIFIILE